MKPIDIPDVDDERVLIPFTLPIKGKKPMSFKLPRLDYIPAEDVKQLLWLSAELDNRPDRVAELLGSDPEYDPTAMLRAVALLWMKPYLTAAQFKILQKCSWGALSFVDRARKAQSNITVGELWASSGSLKSTEGPSTQTSSTAATHDSTSDEDSDGETSATS